MNNHFNRQMEPLETKWIVEEENTNNKDIVYTGSFDTYEQALEKYNELSRGLTSENGLSIYKSEKILLTE